MNIKEKEYQRRRKTLLRNIQEGVILISSASHQIRSNDTEYLYRQNSNFYYLSGFEEDNALLVLKKSSKGTKIILFVQSNDKTKELWNGKRLGVKAAKKSFVMDKIYGIEKFDEVIKKELCGSKNIYVDLFDNDEFSQKIRIICKTLNHDRSVKVSPQNFLHVNPIIEKMRLIKSASEIKTIKKALSITKKAHDAAMRQAKDKLFEYELQATIEHVFKSNGAYSDAYTTIVAGGNNANILHYIKNDCPLKKGDLVLIDAGCEYEMYASDITRTFPVSGKFSQPQKELYEMVLRVQFNIINAIKPGIKRSKLQKLCEKQLCQGMINLRILKGECKKLLKKGAHKKYFPHGVGHWMGIDVHDQCPYSDEKGNELVFKSGMVLTIEPGIYINKNDKNVPKRYRGIGIRIEDDILVTKKSSQNLSKDIVKSVKEIESLCSSKTT